jgi:hypothetical protein
MNKRKEKENKDVSKIKSKQNVTKKVRNFSLVDNQNISKKRKRCDIDSTEPEVEEKLLREEISVRKILNLSSNIISYIADFLDINETFQIFNVNKKFRRCLKVKRLNNHIDKLEKMRAILINERITNLNDLLQTKGDFYSSKILNSELKTQLSEEQISDSFKFSILLLSKKYPVGEIKINSNINYQILKHLFKIFKSSNKEKLGKIFKLKFSVLYIHGLFPFNKNNQLGLIVNFLNYLTYHFSFDTLQFINNRISEEEAVSLSNIFRNNINCLKTLFFTNNTISDIGVSNLFKYFNSNINLKIIDLSNSSLISNKSAETFAEIIKTSPELEKLNFWCNKLSNDGVKIISEALKKKYSKISKNKCFLKELHFGGNEVGDEGAVAIAEFLKDNNSLGFLNLGRNVIGSQGAIAIAEAIKQNNTLYKISFSNNRIGTEGAYALSEALKLNNSLKEFYIRDNPLGLEGENALKSAKNSKPSDNRPQLFLYPEYKYNYDCYYDSHSDSDW